jgi:hypothetical protein
MTRGLLFFLTLAAFSVQSAGCLSAKGALRGQSPEEETEVIPAVSSKQGPPAASAKGVPAHAVRTPQARPIGAAKPTHAHWLG